MKLRNSLPRLFYRAAGFFLLLGCSSLSPSTEQSGSQAIVQLIPDTGVKLSCTEEKNILRNRLYSSLRPLVYRIEVSVPLLYRVEKYQGTGWAWADKYLWTCKHLIPSAKNLHIEVWDASGTCHEARVVWRDSIADVALLVMDTMHASVGISLRDESFPKVGESVFSLGAPLGLLGTFQEGFVASEPRILDEKKSQPRQLLLQLSIPAQIGSSGSPVVDSQGNLIGMISDIATLSGGYEGICFAIPAQVLSQVWEKYRKFAANDTERPRPSY